MTPEIASIRSSEVAATPATDELLLARFLAGTPQPRLLGKTKAVGPAVKSAGEAAFAELVARHGPMVLAVCRRTLGRRTDAEDAFQATFLVLARKARSLRNAASLPAWLYQTAYRIALRARAARAKRRELPLENEAMIAPDTLRQIAHDYEQSLLDDELDRLPEKYRLPVFLCCLEGKSLDEAARQLGWSIGSVKGRLERGRQELRSRMMLRRGAPAVAVALALCLPKVATASTHAAANHLATAALPSALVSSTVKAGVSYAAGHGTLGFVSHHALSLAQGSTQLMTVLKFAACSTLSLGLLAWGAAQVPASTKSSGDAPRHVIQLETGADLSAVEASPPANFGAIALAGDGDAPRREGARDGDAPREGAPRDGDQPRSSVGLREGAPREGARDGAPREGAREGNTQMANDPLRGFRPANQREAVLLQMIMQLRAEVAELRSQMQSRRVEREGLGDGDGRPKTGLRDGEGAKAGPRDGDKPRTGPRDGEGAPKEGARDGEGSKKPAERDG